ncbi:MAG: hypothetical protein R2851_23350 [Caldilineaceae bacterium]
MRRLTRSLIALTLCSLLLTAVRCRHALTHAAPPTAIVPTAIVDVNVLTMDAPTILPPPNRGRRRRAHRRPRPGGRRHQIPPLRLSSTAPGG